MRNFSALFYLLVCAGLAVAGGCTLPDQPLDRSSAADYPDVDIDTAFAAAEKTMSEFFRIETSDRGRGVIRAVPAVATPARAGEIVPRISSPSAVRHIAELRLSQVSGGTRAQCRVIVQRNDGTERQSYIEPNSIDAPNRTPLEESRGYADTGGMVWTTTGYDRELERSVLAALAERLAGAGS